MLTSIGLSNFKSYDEATLSLADLTVLIGANASGKSNLVEALQLISWLAQGRRLADLPYALEKEELAVRGKNSELFLDKKIPLSFTCRFSNIEGELTLELYLSYRNDELVIQGESLSADWLDSNVPFLYKVVESADQEGDDIFVSYNNFKQGKNKPKITCTGRQAVFSQLQTPARFDNKYPQSQQEIPRNAKAVQDLLQRILFLDPVPGQMRGYSFPSEHRLRGDGSNLSAILFKLCKSEASKTEVLDFVKQLPEQDISEIAFMEGPRGEVMVRLIETFGAREEIRDAAVLSDGTLRVLAIAAALLSVDEGSLVVVEEIDNGVHPSRAGKLLERIKAIAERRSLRVLLTTHNPALLDALPDSAVPNVTFCYRDPNTGTSRLAKLENLDEYPSLIARGSLGALMTKRVIDKYVKEPIDEERRKKRNAEFIASLRRERS